MSFPPLLTGAAALFWGWQTGQPAVGAALALLLEVFRVIPHRLDLSEAAYRRIADYCAVALAALAALLVANRGTAAGVLGTLQWLPLAVAPVVLAQRFGRSGLIRASALLLYLRRQLRRDPATEDGLLDVSGPYTALLVVAAGAANDRGPGYFAGAAMLAAWALYALRPRSAPRVLFVFLLALATTLGFAGHVGLNRLQATVESWVDEWLVVLPVDVERTTTRIGSVGRLKQHDAIAMRVFASRGNFKLLHAASFNEYRNGTWVARAGGDAGATGAASEKATLVLRVQGGKTPLPLPPGTVEVDTGGGLAPESAGLGVLSVDSPPGWLRYEARFGEGAGHYPQAGRADFALPPAERATLERLVRELGLAGRTPAQAIAMLEAYFAAFKYSTWRERAPQEGMTALEDFLLASRTGHCEYFAAATTLLLRAAGIPARYATGYAVLEYSELERAWVVRARHAHAWARAYVDGRWMDVDLTPGSWPEVESELRPPWEKLVDLGRWLAYRWSTATGPDASLAGWIAAIALVLAGLLFLRRRRPGGEGEAVLGKPRWGGLDSEFYGVMDALARRHRPRAPHEPAVAWLASLPLAAEQREALHVLLRLHCRYRFDPQGLAPRERATLRTSAAAALQSLQLRPAPVRR